MTFAIAMGVRRDDEALQHEIEAVLARRRSDIDAILSSYHVPLVQAPQTAAGPAP
jgi:hypothetical protein